MNVRNYAAAVQSAAFFAPAATYTSEVFEASKISGWRSFQLLSPYDFLAQLVFFKNVLSKTMGF